MGHKAVVVGANYYIGLSAIRSLGRMGVHVVAVDYDKDRAYAFRSKYCKEKLIAPYYKEDPKEFIQFLVDYGKKQEHKPVIIPSADAYAELLDQNYDILKKYFLMPNPSQGFYTNIMYKNILHELAQDYGVNTPETLSPKDIDRVDEEIGYPCLLKPTTSPDFVSVFRVKVFVANNRQELEQAIEKAREHNMKVIVQRIIPGFDDKMHTYDAYVDKKGEVTHWTTCQKKRQYPVNFGASVFTQQKYIPELHEIGSQFLKRLGYRGFAEIEMKYDETRETFYLIEINVRLSNLNALLERAGLNFPYIMYRDLIGDPLPPKGITHDTGLHFWAAMEDAYALRDYLRKRQLRPTQILGSFFTRKVPSIWEWKDPAPALTYGSQLVKRVTNKIFRR